MKFVRSLVGLAVVVLLAAGLAGCSQTKLLSDLRYAPGYGYVVKAEYSRNVDDRPDDYFFVFDTEEEARDFIKAVSDDPSTRLAIDRRKYGEHSPPFKEIERLAGPVPPRVTPDAVNRVIDRVAPPVPTSSPIRQ